MRQVNTANLWGWKNWVLVIAAIYHIVWGAFAFLFPRLTLELVRIDPPNDPCLWQCLGMIVGVYGGGYAIAASDPNRHWPIVLVGLLGKVFGPIGFVWAASHGELPWIAGLTILTNDLIWWFPFGRILLHARWAEQRPVIARPVELIPSP